QRYQPRRHRLHGPVIPHRRGAELGHVRGPAVEPDQRFVVDDVGMVGSAVASDVEALAEIRFGVLVDRRMPHDLPAERQVPDVVLADLERELVLFGAGEESLGDGERVVDQMLRHAVMGDDEKPGVFAGSGNGTRQRRGRACLAGEIRADIEHRNAAVSRGLGLGGGETHGSVMSARSRSCSGSPRSLCDGQTTARPLPTRGCGRPPSATAITTTISSGRGASGTVIVSVSKWSNDHALSLWPSGTSIDAPAAATFTFEGISASPPATASRIGLPGFRWHTAPTCSISPP